MSGRLTILSQWYPPEQAPFGRMMHELAADLAQRGWDVTVITGFPNHPRGTVFDGYQKRWCLEESSDGVRICRVWLATCANRSTATRLATFATFTLTSTWRLLRMPRPDVVFAVMQPLSLAMTLPLIARLKRCALVFNLQDLHPDTQIRLGMVRHRWLIGALRALERYGYRHCAALSVICDAFRVHAVRCGASPERVHVIGNWVDTHRIHPVPEEETVRREAGIAPGQFVALWAGTLGHVSGAMLVLEAAECLRDRPDIRILIIGEGPLRADLLRSAAARGLSNVAFLPFQPEDRLCAVQSAGDVSIVTLSADFAESSVPSKVLAYLAAGRAVIAAVPGHSPTAEMIQRAGVGVVVDAGDAVALAAAIRSLADDRGRARRLGGRARDFAAEHLSRAAATERYNRLFTQLRRNR
jgi:colanic acid biosynthesis glycosyl transferase WcaI